LDEENRMFSGLAQEMGLALHNSVSCHGWYKAQQRRAPAEKSVVNTI
jgi:hypothetical protein